MVDVLTARNSSDDEAEESYLMDGFDFICRGWEVKPPVLRNARARLLTELL